MSRRGWCAWAGESSPGMPSVAHDSGSADLFEVVDQAVEPPLGVDLHGAAQGRAIHPFVGSDVGKDRFDRAQPLAVDRAALGGVDLVAHS